ncbi:amidohydrolase family protein [Pseudokineococcus sp. 5B2Z-1]|uniref:amidohydrolase n=1 Tax=Pseudokineococcus sp. 5B2Z-1 TaxID=3132744 RepID=UPI0030ADC6C3
MSTSPAGPARPDRPSGPGPAGPPPARADERPRSVLYLAASVYSPADPFATALLVEGDRVSWVGSHEAAQAQRGRADVVVEAPGALVTAGFVDAHAHVTEAGLAAAGLDLTGVASADELLDRVAAAAAADPGRPLLGHGWDDDAWAGGGAGGGAPGARLPSREELDRAAGGAEVLLSRVDVHSALVSSALADRAGLAGLEGAGDGALVRLRAHDVARDASRRLAPAERERAQRRGLAAAAAAGVATVTECSAPHVGSPEDLRALRALSDAGEVPEVLAYWGAPARDEAEAAAALADVEGAGVLGLAGDLCVDGSYGSRTAWLRAPYADLAGTGLPADHAGVPHLSAADVADHLVACTRAGVQGGFHVIGDAAADALVEGLLAAEARVGTAALASARHRVEHLEAPDARAVAELARLGVVASVQPAFDARWGGPDGLYARRLGSERAAALNPFADLAAAGVPLALGSDAPVTPFDPWGAVRAAAAATPGPAGRARGLSARAAFLAHTRGGWRAARRDGEGVLVPGGAATLAVWEVGDLVVQAADARVSSWSTDPRSGVPGLPDLSEGAAAPRCLRLLRAGRVLHDTGDLAA